MPSAACCRRTNFWVLPVGVMGSPSTKVQNTGILCGAIWSRRNSGQLGGRRPGEIRPQAQDGGHLLPHFSSGTPITAAVSMAG